MPSHHVRKSNWIRYFGNANGFVTRYNETVAAAGVSTPLLNRAVRPHQKTGLETMTPREVVAAWVETFNRGDADGLANFYSPDAINHQVAEEPVSGRDSIRSMFESGFAEAKMVCIVENIFQDGDWAILEWRDPLGLRGCGFFKVKNGKIVFQRGYWDKLTFLRQHGLPIPR